PSLMQNWRGQIVRLLGDTPSANLLALVLAGGTLVLVALLWRGPGNRGRWEPGTPNWDRRWAATLLAALLITPYLLPHDLCLAIVPGWILAAHPAGNRAWGAWIAAGWGAGLLVLNATLPLIPAVLWMAGTAGLLFWQLHHHQEATPL
ncbi:MAG TPA: hypothetical protein VM536_07725, partial [Chloroflexia bacterium]|nr:hypothetical protein [Chloroflexia bacterium]